jgi:hypothetical protein
MGRGGREGSVRCFVEGKRWRIRVDRGGCEKIRLEKRKGKGDRMVR